MNTKKILLTLRKWIRMISPPLPVGGLQVNDFAVRYVQIKGSEISRASIRLKPGVVVNGRVKDRAALKNAATDHCATGIDDRDAKSDDGDAECLDRAGFRDTGCRGCAQNKAQKHAAAIAHEDLCGMTIKSQKTKQ